MAKRTYDHQCIGYDESATRKFKRLGRDSYDSPPRVLWPLLAHVPAGTTFAEPCAGQGNIIRHLALDDIHCRYASDIHPRQRNSPMKIEKRDALKVTAAMLRGCDMVISNPPWTTDIMHAIVEHFLPLIPAWYLWSADWLHNKESAYLVTRCSKIVSVGRVCWFPETGIAGKDNCIWCYFPTDFHGQPTFYGRKG